VITGDLINKGGDAAQAAEFSVNMEVYIDVIALAREQGCPGVTGGP
jgi:hypothetical protein